ncbi:MAG: 50S ribosomal protein L9 [Bacteroidales bacterium]|nr:50S ribosomal protein L9 [Bacteroidales bacterium]
MEIILKQDVENLGHVDEIVNVKPGYARNYLIPQGYAILATKTAKKIHEENMRQKAHKEAKLRENAEALSAKLEGLKIKVAAKTSSTGKIFGSVNTIMLSEALAKEGFEIDRKNITIKGDSIKEVGEYTANIKIYKNIRVNIDFEVFSDQ